MSSVHLISYFSNNKCNFGAMPGTIDRFFKNYSVNIKITHLTSKSLNFVLCMGYGYVNFARWINQCQFGYKRSSAHRILYFSNTKCNFLTFPVLVIDFSKFAHLTLKFVI